MKAVYIQQHAPIEGLRVTDRPEPWVNPGEVLVHVEAAGRIVVVTKPKVKSCADRN